MKIQPKILHISDSSANAKIIKGKLTEWGLAIDQKQAASLDDYLEITKSRQWDIVITEYEYSDFTAFDILDSLKDSGYRFYIIVLYENLPDDKLLDLIKAGVSDCIPKDRLSNLRNVIFRIANNIYRFGTILQEKYADIGYLSARIAHEINNPLSFVDSNFDTLSKYCGSFNELIRTYKLFKEQIKSGRYESTEKHLKTIEDIEKRNNIDFALNEVHNIFRECSDGLKRIGNVVKGLSSFAVSETGEKYEMYDINDGIETVLLVVQNELKLYEIKKELGETPLIKAIGSQITQALLNIIINSVYAISIKHGVEKGIIKISTYSDEKFVYCKIEDNGIGITKENMKKVFDPFFTTKSDGQGIGIGLSITYDTIVRRHNGQLSVKSEYGKGAAFIIKLPVSK